MFRLERVFQRRAYLLQADVPLAGLAEQRLGQVAGQLLGQQRRERPLHPQQFSLLVDGLDEQATFE
ncbi:hypothetical protein D3C81_2175560 [compost metagenome]